MGRHQKIVVDLPGWVADLPARDACLRSVAEDVYYAEALAKKTARSPSAACAEILKAATKSMKIMENSKKAVGERCKEGDRAARKFWEAKVCARR